jgi:hypothetical protein
MKAFDMASTEPPTDDDKPAKKRRPKRPFAPLPPNLQPPDLTVDEVASFRRESRWTVFRKVREGRYRSYLDGRIRKVIFASVLADRDRALRDGIDKRPPGRPKKIAP